MGEMLGIVVGSLGFTALIISPIIVNKIIKFKLEIAKINAETTIKAEEIRGRNQIEIEKLVKQETCRFSNDEEINESPDRVRRRL